MAVDSRLLGTVIVLTCIASVVLIGLKGTAQSLALRAPNNSVWLVAPKAIVSTSDLSAAQATNPQAIVDHDPTTLYWTGRAPVTGDYVEVDLGDIYPVNAVALLMGSTSGPFARPYDYLYRGRILVSVDGSTWDPVGRDLSGLSEYYITFAERPVRYIRITATADQAYWVQIRELLVAVPQDAAPAIRPAWIAVEEATQLLDVANRDLDAARRQLVTIDAVAVSSKLDQAADILSQARTAYSLHDDAAAIALAKQAQRLSSQAALETLETRGHEVRAAWVDRGVLVAGPTSVLATLDRLQGLGINVIYPEVMSKGAAAYRSDIYPFDPEFTSWPVDIMTFLVTEAHARGIEVHPWVWVMCAGYYHQSGPLLLAHPNWAELSMDGDMFAPNEWGTAWLSPVIPEVRQFLSDAFVELVTKYDVDGIHFDYIRYNEEGYRAFGYSDVSLQAFAQATGLDAQRLRFDSERQQWHQWRAANITQVVTELTDALRAARPELNISAAVVSDPNEALSQTHQDWAQWLAQGQLDHVTLMNYTGSLALFSARNQLALSAVERGAAIPGIGIWTTTAQGVVDQVVATQSAGAVGVAFFAASTLVGETERLLREGPFRAAAALPFADPWLALAGAVDELKEDVQAAVATDLLPEDAYGLVALLGQLHDAAVAGTAARGEIAAVEPARLSLEAAQVVAATLRAGGDGEAVADQGAAIVRLRQRLGAVEALLKVVVAATR